MLFRRPTPKVDTGPLWKQPRECRCCGGLFVASYIPQAACPACKDLCYVDPWGLWTCGLVSDDDFEEYRRGLVDGRG